MKASLFLVALLAPVALYAAPGVVSVVGDEAAGIFTKQYAAPAAHVVYTGVSPVVGTSFVPVVYSDISSDAGAGVFTVVDNSLVQPIDDGAVVPTLYHQAGRYQSNNQISGSSSSYRPGYFQGRPTGYQTGFQAGQSVFQQGGHAGGRPGVIHGSGFGSQGVVSQGFGSQGFGPQGFGSQGIVSQGFGTPGHGSQGIVSQGFGTQGFGNQGFVSQGFGSQGLVGVSSAYRPGSFQQGVQQSGPINRPGQFRPQHFSGSQTVGFPGQFSGGFGSNQGVFSQGAYQNHQHRPVQTGQYVPSQGLQTVGGSYSG